jgi:NAD(P)-dependent dehydrogenase (short-subunit alcohol dehydrogenase family)
MFVWTYWLRTCRRKARSICWPQTFLDKYDCLDVLVNNAGVLRGHLTVTEDGLETTFAVNHLAYFQLTALLSDRLIKTPRRVW